MFELTKSEFFDKVTSFKKLKLNQYLKKINKFVATLYEIIDIDQKRTVK